MASPVITIQLHESQTAVMQCTRGIIWCMQGAILVIVQGKDTLQGYGRHAASVIFSYMKYTYTYKCCAPRSCQSRTQYAPHHWQQPYKDSACSRLELFTHGVQQTATQPEHAVLHQYVSLIRK